ncbi:MAG TPA: RNA polymerase sigma factor, partial [Chthonomonadaceae bacterium]|nr:RNA polymerase sigma factor [Chthonomonadaceae bacterium]
REYVPEVEWRQRLAQGDLEVVALLYDHYAAALYRVLTAILGTTADAEDALQEVFVRLAQGRANRVQNLRPYLFAAARHEACNILRRKRRERPLEEAERPAPPVDTTQAGEMQRLLLRLPLEQREVIAMKVYEEMTFAEIATIVKASPNTVASRYRYGIERLRGWVQEEEAYGNQA